MRLFLGLALAFLLALPASAQIARVSSADLGNVASGTLSVTYTVGSGANRMLAVVILGDASVAAGGGGFDDISTVTYNGVALTLAVKDPDTQTSSERFIYLYYLLNPASGSHTVTVNSTNAHVLYPVVADYNGVRQSGQTDATTTDGGTVTSTTTSITTVAANTWVL